LRRKVERKALWATQKQTMRGCVRSLSSRTAWERSPNEGSSFCPKLNTDKSPIAHKYREGKMKRTLKKELKVLEIAERETIGTSFSCPSRIQPTCVCPLQNGSSSVGKLPVCVLAGQHVFVWQRNPSRDQNWPSTVLCSAKRVTALPGKLCCWGLS